MYAFDNIIFTLAYQVSRKFNQTFQFDLALLLSLLLGAEVYVH